MSRSTTLAYLTLPIVRGRELIGAFGGWWLGEFLGLFPQRFADWLVDDGARVLVLAPEPDAIALVLKTDGGRAVASRRVSRSDYSADLIDDLLRRHRLNRAQVPIGLRLSGGMIFQRSLVLPVETRRALDAVVVQDLLAKTPFQLDDIHHAHHVRRAGDKLVVSQWIVRRARVAAAAEALGLAPEEIGFVEADDEGHESGGPRIAAESSGSANRSRWVQRISLGLVATAVLLAVGLLGSKYQRQQAVLDGLQAEVAGATAKVKSVQGMIDRLRQEQALLARLRARREEPGLLDIWDDVTRTLPTHTWLSELRLSEASGERHVVMTGLSAAAASLVGLLDRSAIFTEASLVGPVTVDPVEGKERFIVQVKLRTPAASETAAR
jgi:general secretion pathway protein L